jgi:hypothetical protein
MLFTCWMGKSPSLLALLMVIVINLDLFMNRDANFVIELFNRGENLSIAFEIVCKSEIEMNVFDKLIYINISTEKKIAMILEASDNQGLDQYLYSNIALSNLSVIILLILRSAILN